jgi:hypothetical protein
MLVYALVTLNYEHRTLLYEMPLYQCKYVVY